MPSRHAWTPVRQQVALLALVPALLGACSADDPTAAARSTTTSTAS